MSRLLRLRGHTFWDSLTEESIVVDFGAHAGDFSSQIIDRYRCRCIAVEADPRLAADLSPHPGLTICHFALSDRNGETSLYVAPNREASSIRPPSDQGSHSVVRVDSKTLETFFGEQALESVQLVKMDIEGAEIEVLLTAPTDLLAKIGQISVEFHDHVGLTPTSDVRQVLHRMQGLGFRAFVMSGRNFGDVLLINQRHTRLGPVQSARIRWVEKPKLGLIRIARRSLSGRDAR